MKKSLTINATRAGKKVSKNIGYVNPEVANSLVGGFAQMVNALTTDTFVNAEVVKKMDTSEEEQQSGGSSPAPAKQKGIITYDGAYHTYYNGDGTLYAVTNTGVTTIASGALTPCTHFFAPETDNYTAAVYIVEGGDSYA